MTELRTNTSYIFFEIVVNCSGIMCPTERLSISIDENSKRKLDSLKRQNISTSECIRHLIDIGYTLFKESEVDYETLSIWVKLLAKREHVIMDMEYLRLIFSELERIQKEDFWKKIREIAASHAIEFKVRGFNSVEDILKFMEKSNWFEFKKISEGVFSLIPIDFATKNFIKVSFEEIFSKLSLPVKIKEGFGKLMIIDLNKCSEE